MARGERVIRSERIYDGLVVSLRRDEVELPSGRTAVREIVEHRGAVAVVPLTDAGEALLVRQFRAPIGRRLLEVPAGTMEPGESAETCAARELAEEVGMHAEEWQPLGTIYPSPGFLTEAVHLFAARHLSPHALDAEEEDLEVIAVPLMEARGMVISGEISDAKSVAAILLLTQREGGAA